MRDFRRGQERPGEPRRRDLESPGQPRRSQERPGEARRAQESPGESPGETRIDLHAIYMRGIILVL